MGQRKEDYMARLGNRLEPAFVAKVTAPGRYPDGHGLYLLVGPSGGKSWFFRYKINKKPHDLGLGPFHTVSLKDARRKALTCRQQRLDGLDPLAERRRTQGPALDEITFEECARHYIAAKRAEWKGDKSLAQWRHSLGAYVLPRIGRTPVQSIDTGAVIRVLDPIWREKTETASRVRQRIEAVLDWAAARGYRQGENPARWKGHLENLLPRPSKVRSVHPHAALPASEIPALLEALRGRQSVAARALEFIVLTSVRVGEAVGARWDELDLAERVWTIPASRMKGGVEHRVPLSTQAVAVIECMAAIRHSEFVFPGQPGKALGRNAVLAALKSAGYEHATTHGFRASFRTWAAESTSFASEIAEAALGHQVGSAVERAYRRGDFFTKRRRLMEAWSTFCTTPATQFANNVRAIRI
jgi:integrase